MKSFKQILAATAILLSCSDVARGASQATPQMGWNTQDLLVHTADLLVSTGLKDAGYTNLVLDDGWQALNRSEDGKPQPNATKFPNGIPPVAEHIHQAGLRFGIYMTNGIKGCGPNSPGSWGFEEIDAQQFADWNVDYLKYDNCGTFEAGTHPPQSRFRVMSNALRETGRDILYSLCQWGDQFPWYWADQVAHSYRISGDITATFSDRGKDCACKTAYCLNTGYAGCSVMTIIRKMREISYFQHPGSFADMDMLEIGIANLTLHEERTHFSFWAALKSPLIVGADLRKITNETLSVLKNKKMIAVNQDKLGSAIEYLPHISKELEHQIWAGQLSGNRTIVLAFNELNDTMTIDVPFSSIPRLNNGSSYKVEDVWSESSQTARSSITASLESHETKVYIFKEE
ncbi:related to alpha-galactosidase [Melanopsichium pennsylvanicum]|uniref:Alpha-galactosidase n=1 Tax=Melanopsichium pennsylvanicum TaxID=63383 RepID=A0AAJ4XMS8_9BASI|nr:related to alpha-galactosidase [Melanopsichium pennsylvanicum]